MHVQKGATNGNRVPSLGHRSNHTYSINITGGSYCKLTQNLKNKTHTNTKQEATASSGVTQKCKEKEYRTNL